MTTLYTAKKYAVPALEKNCVDYLKRHLCADNAFLLLTQARLFDEPQVRYDTRTAFAWTVLAIPCGVHVSIPNTPFPNDIIPKTRFPDPDFTAAPEGCIPDCLPGGGISSRELF